MSIKVESYRIYKIRDEYVASAIPLVPPAKFQGVERGGRRGSETALKRFLEKRGIKQKLRRSDKRRRYRGMAEKLMRGY